MTRTAQTILGLAVAAAAGWAAWSALRDSPEPREEIRRDAFAIPAPTPDEKNTFLFDLFASGDSISVEGQTYPIWRLVGENGLLRAGDSALDYLMDPARFATYRASPNILINVFRVLLAAPEAMRRPGYENFLKHWLDPANAPRALPGSNPAEQFRQRVFALFTRGVQPWVVPYCVEELDVTEAREPDLRKIAVAALLHLGRTEAIVDRFDSLPPNDDEPEVQLRPFALYELRKLAMPGVPEARREGVRKFEALLRRALKSESAYSRMNAASTLLKLGDPSMVDYLLALADETEAAGDGEACWSALIQLSEDSKDLRLRARAEKRIADDPDNLDYSYAAALQILAFRWIDDAQVRETIWAYVHARHFDDLRAIRWLSLYPDERTRIVETLRRELRGDDPTVQQAALRFATTPSYPLPELMPDVLELARERSRGEGRSRLLSALVSMDFRPVIPLLMADLEEEDPQLRATAAADLLEFGIAEEVAAVKRRMDQADMAMLGPLLHRARAKGADGIPDSLLPPLLRMLEQAPGEPTRLRILLILRCRGTLDGVADGLMEAYRREPSERVATAIREAITELAHGT